jgi:O-methyltransferase
MLGEDKHQEGLKLLEQGQSEEAVRLFAVALEQEPSSERWNDWAAGQMACGHTDKAEEGFRRALSIDAADGQASVNLGVLLAGLGRETEAVPFLKAAAEKIGEPQRAVAQEVLANCSRKVAAEALAQSQAVFKNLVSELEESWPAALAGKASEVARPLPLWDEDAEFDGLCRDIEHITLDRVRCYILYQFAKQASALPGNVAEVGVYKGGSARILSQTIASRAQKKVVHLFDTFAGMPATDASVDFHSAGDFADTSLQAVQSDLRDCHNVRFYQGFFPDTGGAVKNRKFCLAHVDVDIYSSVRDCCLFFYPRMVSRGIILFDDYGFNSCPGARKAVDEFFGSKREKPFYLPTGQCFVVKECASR